MKNRNQTNVSKTNSKKTLLVRIALSLAILFTIFGASPALAVTSIDIIHHTNQTVTNNSFETIHPSNDYNHNNIPDDEETVTDSTELQINEIAAKVRNHDWFKKDFATANGIQKFSQYSYTYSIVSEDIYELKPGGI